MNTFSDASARRPLHAPAAKDVKMQVLNALLSVLAGIDDDPEALFGNAKLVRKLFDDGLHISKGVRIHIEYAPKMLFGYQQHMHGCLGVYVPEGKHALVLIDLVRGYLAPNYLTEKTVIHIILNYLRN